MCQPKPGPRCKPHARKELGRAQAALEAATARAILVKPLASAQGATAARTRSLTPREQRAAKRHAAYGDRIARQKVERTVQGAPSVR